MERKKAEDLFGTIQNPTSLATSIMGIKSKIISVPSAKGGITTSSSKSYRVKLTDKERRKVEELIRNAKSLQEIIRLEKELDEGRVPAAALDINDPMEE